MEKITCKRCGRPLRSQDSIKRGYGPKCFKIIHIEGKIQEEKITNEIDFLKCEINMIKRQLKQSQHATIVHESRPIERIKKNENRPEKNPSMENFSTVINELKTIFNQGDPKRMLIRVPKEEIKIPLRIEVE